MHSSAQGWAPPAGAAEGRASSTGAEWSPSWTWGRRDPSTHSPKVLASLALLPRSSEVFGRAQPSPARAPPPLLETGHQVTRAFGLVWGEARGGGSVAC